MADGTVAVPVWLLVILVSLLMGAAISWATWVTHNVVGLKYIRRQMDRLIEAVGKIEKHMFGTETSLAEGGREK